MIVDVDVLLPAANVLDDISDLMFVVVDLGKLDRALGSIQLAPDPGHFSFHTLFDRGGAGETRFLGTAWMYHTALEGVPLFQCLVVDCPGARLLIVPSLTNEDAIVVPPAAALQGR
jgi:hypothetical protein